ncbi:MAG: hypothetical protein PVI90_14200 [Desulfobacteraceae bacterium]|jgi:hypothetical protein
MKDIQQSYIFLLKILFTFLIILLLPPQLIHSADSDHYSEETVISFDFENTELSQVLKQISWVTGYSFVINREYADLQITASFDNVPLHQGLKEIIGKRSYTITYEPNKTVALAIYKSSPRAPYIQRIYSSPRSNLNYTISPENIDDELPERFRRANFQDTTLQKPQLDQDQMDFQDEEDMRYDEEDPDYSEDDQYYEEENADYPEDDQYYEEENADYPEDDQYYEEENADYPEDDQYYEEDNTDYAEEDQYYEEDNTDYAEEDQYYEEDNADYPEDDQYYEEDNTNYAEEDSYYNSRQPADIDDARKEANYDSYDEYQQYYEY